MRKTLSFFVILSMLFSMAVHTVTYGEEYEIISAEFTNLEMNMRSDLSGNFTDNESGAVKTNAICGSFIEGKINVETPGVYHFYADMLMKTTGGIIQMSVDNKDEGVRVNTYASKNVENRVDFGSAYIAEKGEHTVRFTAKDKTGNGYDIGIKKLIIEKESVHISAETANIGNVFVEGEEVTFDVSIKNMSEKELNITLEQKAVSSYDTIVSLDDIEFKLAPKKSVSEKITFNITEKNTYDLELIAHIPDEKENIVYTAPFSYIEYVDDDINDDMFGTCTHLTSLKKDSEKLDSVMTMLDKAGFATIRDEYYWDHVELVKGEHTFYADDYVNALNDTGIKPMICLSYSNPFYGVPHDEAG